jgi:hypothetical protein
MSDMGERKDMGAMVAEVDRQVLLASMMPSALVMGMDSMQDCPCEGCQARARLVASSRASTEAQAEAHARVHDAVESMVVGKGGKGDE